MIKKIIMSACLVGFGLIFSLLSCGSDIAENEPEPLLKDLVAYYPFNGNAFDESKNNHDGNPNGVEFCDDRHSNPMKACLFDGSDTIGIQSDSLLNFGINDFSICFWMKASFGEDLMVMGKSNGAIPNLANSSELSHPGWNIQIENTSGYGPGIRLDLWDGENGNYNIVSSKEAVDGVWHYVTFTVDRDSLAKLYIDGIKKDERSVSHIGNLNNNDPFRIGKRSDYPTHNYKGCLDQIRLYRRLLTESEITQLYEDPS